MSSPRNLAVAFDLGTTTIAASLVDRDLGSRLGLTSALNPQRAWGADVLTRITAASTPEGLASLKDAVACEMERMVRELLDHADASPEELSLIAIAANSAMEQIALGLSVDSLAGPPFRPAFKEGKATTTRALGWTLEIPAYLFPLPGGFVGGDLVAFLFGLKKSPRPKTLYLDLGTNAEIALFDGERFFATSAAAGPAFEGGNLKCGMAALPGAISSVEILGERLTLATIDSKPPLGICGSGVLDAVAALLDAGILDRTGRLLPAAEIPSNLANRRVEIAGVPAFVLNRDARGTVFIDQEDIRALQLAKGALRGGVEVLLDRALLSVGALDEVILTGSFGAVISPATLKRVGVFGENMVMISSFIREGALAGVERFLAEEKGRDRLEGLSEEVRVIPLSGTPLFEKLFLANLDFGKT